MTIAKYHFDLLCRGVETSTTNLDHYECCHCIVMKRIGFAAEATAEINAARTSLHQSPTVCSDVL